MRTRQATAWPTTARGPRPYRLARLGTYGPLSRAAFRPHTAPVAGVGARGNGIRPHRIGILAAHATVEYRRPGVVSCPNRMWTDFSSRQWRHITMSDCTFYPCYDIECPDCHQTFDYALPPETYQVRCKSCRTWHLLTTLRTGHTTFCRNGQASTRPESSTWWRPAPRRLLRATQQLLASLVRRPAPHGTATTADPGEPQGM
jgi:hypothetical protein